MKKRSTLVRSFTGIMKSSSSRLLTLGMGILFLGASQQAAAQCPTNGSPIHTIACSSGDYINSFTLNSIAASNSGCNGQPNNWITYSSPVWDLQPGQTYNFSYTTGSYGQGLGIWIDLNNNGNYESTEYMAGTPSSTSGSGTITIPSGTPAALGVKMRLRCFYASTPPSTAACSSTGFGESEDYTVNIVVPCTGTPNAGTAVATPSTFVCSGIPTLSLSGSTAATGLTYQWQSKPTGSTTWTNLGSAQTSPSYTPGTAITSSRDYRCIVTCTSSSQTATSAAVTANVTTTTITPSGTASLCTPPNDQTLGIVAPALPDTIFKELFNGSTHSMTTTASASGCSWLHTTSPYFWSYFGYNIQPPDNSKFLYHLMNTYPYSFTTSNVESPTFSTVGYTSATLSFQHWFYYNYQNQGYVEISTNGGSSWTALTTYSSTQGGSTSWSTVTFNLSAYLNQANCKIRFRQTPYYAAGWGMDNIVITGVHPPLTYAWSASPSTGAGLPGTAGTPSLANSSIVANPNPGSYTYTATITGQAGGCPSTASVVINVGPKPSGVISGDNTICNGDQTPLTVNFTTGAPPYQLIYSDGTTNTTMNNITTSSVTFPVSPSNSVVYTIVGLATPVCTASSAQMTGSATVNVNQRPTSSMANLTQTICDASSVFLPITFTGTPPFDITYSDGSNSYTMNGITALNYQLPITVQTGVHTYTVTSITDANGCMAQPGDMTGSATITSQIRPTGTITGNPTLCNGSLATVQVSFTGTPPYSFGYSDGGSFIYSVNNITSNPYTLVVAPSSTVTYTLDHVTDANCTTIPQDLTGSSFVTVNQRPTSVLSGVGQTICDGNQVNLSVSFSGIPPYNFGYSNGTTSSVVTGIYSSTYNFTVTPTMSGTYIVTGLNDLFCSAQLPDMTGAVPVTVRSPQATLSGTQVTCAGDNVSMLVDFGGPGATPPYTVMYNNGTSNQIFTTSSDPYVLNVTAGNTANYQLLSMTDANCPGDVSGSAMITVNQPGGWKGMISSDWQNPSNWCGVLPTSTTDVHIPSASPNMPVLSYGAGYCDTMTVEAGASVGVTSGANMNIYGDLNNNGVLNWTNGNINMNGGVPQYVSGFLTQNLAINNDAGVVPTSEIEVMALMVMNGNVYLNNADLTMKSGALIIGDNYNRYVHTQGNGTLNMDVSTGPVRFPVGNATYNPVTLTNYGIPDRFEVRVVDAVYADGYGVNPAQVTFPVVKRTWMIGEQIPGGSVVTVKPQWNGMTGEEINFFDRGHSFVRHWDGTTWSYQDSVNAGAAMGTDPYTQSETGYQNFSPFTVGSHSMWPLAIELLDFTAQLQDNNSALLNWQISQSSDAGVFDIEHGTDGANFTKIGEVAAAEGKTGYSNIHRGLAEGRNYYRLKVTDKAGKSGYSHIAVVVTKGMGVEVTSLSPNPVTGVGTVSISSGDATSAEVRILDAVGRVMYSGAHALTQGNNSVSLDMNNLAQGNYTLHVITNNGNATPVKFTKL